jgi:hypothetical protein
VIVWRGTPVRRQQRDSCQVDPSRLASWAKSRGFALAYRPSQTKYPTIPITEQVDIAVLGDGSFWRLWQGMWQAAPELRQNYCQWKPPTETYQLASVGQLEGKVWVYDIIWEWNASLQRWLTVWANMYQDYYGSLDITATGYPNGHKGPPPYQIWQRFTYSGSSWIFFGENSNWPGGPHGGAFL